MTYKKQVDTEHYGSSSHDNLERFISYFNQKKLVTEACKGIDNASILEIGKGNGFLYNYLKNNRYNIKSFDIAEDLNPDYVGDILELEKTVNAKFDIVCCFEVLEHIRYEDLPNILGQMSRVANKKVIISVPQSWLYLSFWIKLPIFRPLMAYLNIPLPLTHKFNGEHYWELGKKGYSLNNFRKLLKNKFSIEDEFTHPLDTYHRYFVLNNERK